MTGTETIAKRLRCFDFAKTKCKGDIFAFALDEHINCSDSERCNECLNGLAIKLADAIEAEKALAASKATKGAKPQLPEGVIWPRYEDGELVKFGDVARVREDIGDVIEVRFYTGKCSEVTIAFEGESTATHYMVVDGPHLKRYEPEVLDADGVPIKVGDTVWYEGDRECVVERIYRQNGDTLLDLDVCGAIWNMANVKPAEVTHRKPDTQEAIESDATMPPRMYYAEHIGHDVGLKDDAECTEAMVLDLLRRQRKLIGGE